MLQVAAGFPVMTFLVLGQAGRLSEYSGTPLQRILAFAGHITHIAPVASADWPEFREYAYPKYLTELDEGIIAMIEDLI